MLTCIHAYAHTSSEQIMMRDCIVLTHFRKEKFVFHDYSTICPNPSSPFRPFYYYVGQFRSVLSSLQTSPREGQWCLRVDEHVNVLPDRPSIPEGCL